MSRLRLTRTALHKGGHCLFLFALGQTQDPLAEDVALDLARASADREAEGVHVGALPEAALDGSLGAEPVLGRGPLDLLGEGRRALD